jgi:hypothetical protein
MTYYHCPQAPSITYVFFYSPPSPLYDSTTTPYSHMN